MVRRKVLKASQERPDDTVYLELLVWVFNQQRDFMSAMAHVRAFDERKGENGRRLMELAEVAAKNGDLDTAYECYALVSANGPTPRICRGTPSHARGAGRTGHGAIPPRHCRSPRPRRPVSAHAAGPR